MKAVVWHGTEDVRVDSVADPAIQEPTDAIVRVTSSGICGSDLHLYKVLGMFMEEGDILGHEPMGIVEEVGAEVYRHRARRPGGRPVQHRVRPVLDVRARALRPVRDDAGAQAREGRGAVRLHEALRSSPGRPGGVSARAAGALRADQGAGGAARRAIRLPLGRSTDRLAGRRVRGRSGRGLRRGARARARSAR